MPPRRNRPTNLHRVNAGRHGAQRKKIQQNYSRTQNTLQRNTQKPSLPSVGSAYFGSPAPKNKVAPNKRKPKPIPKTKKQVVKTKNLVTVYDSLRKGSSITKLIKQLPKNSPLKQYLHPIPKSERTYYGPIERVGVLNYNAILPENVINAYVKNKRIINFFEGIVTTKNWGRLRIYEKREVFAKVDAIIQRVGEKQFTNFLRNKERKKRLVEKITQMGDVTTLHGLGKLTSITKASSEIRRTSLRNQVLVEPSPDSRAAFASLKTYFRHEKKAEIRTISERKKLLKTASPKVKKILMSDVARTLIDNKFLSYFAGTETGRRVLVNLVNNAKGREILHNFRAEKHREYLLKYYLSTPEGQKIFNHAISTKGRREYVARLTSPHHKDSKGWRTIDVFLQNAAQFQEKGMSTEARNQFRQATKLINKNVEHNERKR